MATSDSCETFRFGDFELNVTVYELRRHGRPVKLERRPMDLLGMSRDDDIMDPTGSNATDHRTIAEEIDALAAEVLELMYP